MRPVAVPIGNPSWQSQQAGRQTQDARLGARGRSRCSLNAVTLSMVRSPARPRVHRGALGALGLRCRGTRYKG